MSSETKKVKVLVKDTLIFALGSFGSKVIQFVLMPLYTNYMTSEEYGVSNLVFTIAQLLIPIFSIEIFEALVRFGMSKNENRNDVLKISITVLSTDVLLLLFSLPFFNMYKRLAEWKFYLIVYIFVSILHSITVNYLKVKDKNKSFAVISIINTLVLAVLNIILIAVMKTGVKGYLLANIVALSVSSLIAVVSSGMIYDFFKGHYDTALFKRMVVYSLPLIFNTISWWLISSSDKLMIEAMLTTSALGIYSAAAKIPAIVNIFISVFQQAWGLSTIREVESSNDTSFYKKVFDTYRFIVFGAAICFIAVSRIFMKYYVGAEFSEAANYVPFLVFSSVFSAISTYFGSLYTALKKSLNIMLTTLLSGVINVIFNFIMIKSIGIMGAVYGTVIAYLFVAHIRMIDIKRYLPLKFNILNYVLNVGLLVIESWSVTQNYHYSISIIVVILFFIINYKNILDLVNFKIRKY